MRRTERFTVGDYVYEMTQLPLAQARELRMRMFKTIGPALAQVVANAGAGDAINLRSAGAAINQFVAALNAEDVQWTMVRFCEVTNRVMEQGGKEHLVPLNTPEIVAEQFEGDRLFYADEFLVRGIELNFKQYFLSIARLPSIGERFKAILTGSSSPSPTASTGTSGGSSPA